MKTEKPDHEVAREELEALYARTCPQGKVVRVGTAVDHQGGWKWEHTLWQVLIAGEVLTFKTGTGIKKAPTCAEVLAGYCRDWQCAQYTFADFCADLGYDEDSRRAFDVYTSCQKAGEVARRILGERKLVEQFADLASRL